MPFRPSSARGRVLCITYANARPEHHKRASSSDVSQCEIVSPHSVSHSTQQDPTSGTYFSGDLQDRIKIRPTLACQTFTKTVSEVEDFRPSLQSPHAPSPVSRLPPISETPLSKPRMPPTPSSSRSSVGAKTPVCLIGKPPSMLHRPNRSNSHSTPSPSYSRNQHGSESPYTEAMSPSRTCSSQPLRSP
ncbi:hypothetical protein GEMRC1_003853 [Eukaryota sp. GEM-RC1]